MRGSSGLASVWLLAGFSLAVVAGLVGWPWIEAMQRQAILSTAKKNLQSFRTAATAYVAAHGRIPLDGTRGAPHPEGGYAKSSDGRELSAAESTFGDLLVAGGYLSEVRFPYGGRVQPGAWKRGQEIWPEVRAVAAEEISSRLKSRPPFQSAAGAGRIVLLTVPGLDLAQAAFLKRGLENEPLPAAAKESDALTLKLGLAGSPRAGGDIRFVQDPDSGAYTAFVYILGE